MASIGSNTLDENNYLRNLVKYKYIPEISNEFLQINTP